MNNKFLREVISTTILNFPFENYMTPNGRLKDAYINVADTVMNYLEPGARILDFGCGPCDKTAILQLLGYECYGYDDLNDEWCKDAASRNKIIEFAKECGIRFHLAENGTFPYEKDYFNMIMLHDVLEHLHDSPRELLVKLIELIKTDGYLFITVPSAVNIRKRIAVIMGGTNYPPFDQYYWYPGAWRGHVREYVKNDLVLLTRFLKLEIVELRSCNHMLQKVPKSLRGIYGIFTNLFSGLRDSWLLVARKKVV